MKQVDYVPRKDAEFMGWLKGLKKGATELAALLGVTDEELALLAECAAGFEEDLKKADDLIGKAKAAVSAKDATRRKAEKVARSLAQRMKAHRNYKASLGVGMGIEGAERRVEMKEAKPTGSAKAMGHGVVEVSYFKGEFDGVNVYGEREDGSGLVLLGRDAQSPYEDKRPLLHEGRPEIRRYQLRYVKNDAEVGQMSNGISVTCEP
ncbi:MAG: hypothetical protein NT105_18075 [Verrucomicrobia bacterium]|nr:hypothetical protein [Verrucomicrobiota bacterium]